MIEAIQRYPRTQHLEGSRLQPGGHDLTQVPLSDLRGAYCVVEEKLDGANAGISVGEDGRIRLQSRGHVLVGGAREKHCDLWIRAPFLTSVLDSRSHWLARPIVPNQLADGVDLFAGPS